MELKSEAVIQRCSVKKVLLKIIRKISVPESRESCEFCGIFRNIYFVEHLLTHTCMKWTKQWKNILTNIFTENHWWWCPLILKYSCRFEGSEHGCLQFYLKRTQSQIRSCKTCKVLQSFSFTQHYLLWGNSFWFPATFLTYHFLY